MMSEKASHFFKIPTKAHKKGVKPFDTVLFYHRK